MLIDHEENAAKNLRLTRLGTILRLKSRDRVTVLETMKKEGVTGISGLFGRLYKGKKLTPTQYYNIL